jgi:phenylalanyl-tRNA synthetase beta subunit
MRLTQQQVVNNSMILKEYLGNHKKNIRSGNPRITIFEHGRITFDRDEYIYEFNDPNIETLVLLKLYL